MSRNISLLVILLLLLAHPAGSIEKPRIYFGINLRYHPVAVYKLYQPMLDYLTANTPYRFEMKLSRNYREALKFLREGKVQIFSLGDGAVVEAMAAYGAIPLVKPLNDEGAPFYRCVFVASDDSPIRSLKDLKGRKVAFGYRHSTTGNLVAHQLLAENGIGRGELAAADNLKNHEAVMKAVMKGEFDAGAVKEVIARQYLNRGIRVIATSAPIAAIPLVAARNTPEHVTQAVTDALLRLDVNNPAHRKILATWDAEFRNGFAAAFPADYRELSRQFRSRPYGCGTRCHR
ncbi:MAG TPA: PhnD/SsuA/transferrin family substrate-binding protein [Geobacteraceae bacterium]